MRYSLLRDFPFVLLVAVVLDAGIVELEASGPTRMNVPPTGSPRPTSAAKELRLKFVFAVEESTIV